MNFGGIFAFSDINYHRYKEAIEYVRQKNIVGGYSDGTFRPDYLINRAEFTKIIVGSQFERRSIDNCNTLTQGFSDVPTKAWFAPFVCLAKKRELIDGYPDHTFKPENNITIVEAAKIISNAFGYNQGSSNIQIWYEPFVRNLATAKALPLDIATANSKITRGQLAEIIYRLKQGIKTRTSHSFSSLSGIVLPAPTPAPAPKPSSFQNFYDYDDENSESDARNSEAS